MSIAAAFFTLGVSSAASVAQHAAAGGSLHLPVSRYQKSEPLIEFDVITELQRRDTGSIYSVLSNNQTFYAIDLEIGTPLQPLSLVLDTGSSDVWVFGKSVCGGAANCAAGPVFDSSASSSFKQNDTALSEEYADGSVAIGNWAQDVMQLGDTKINNFNFAVANSSNSTQAVAGVGLPSGEAPYTLGEIPRPYMNLPEQLKQQGIIQRSAYSLWLNSHSKNAGSVLFGAIDHSKYSGDLYRMSLVPTDGYSYVSRFAVPLTGLSTFNSNGVETPFAAFDIPAVFDSGSSVGMMPANYILPFYLAIGAQMYSDNIYLVDCSAFSNKDGGLGLQIGGIDITIGFDDLFMTAAKERVSGKEYCIPGFLVVEDDYEDEGMAVIGDNILRALYVVYDLENLEVAVAAAATGKNAASSSSLEVLSTGLPGSLIRFNASRPATTAYFDMYATTSVSMFGSTTATTVSAAPTPSSYSAAFTSESGQVLVPTAVKETIVIGAKTNLAGASNTLSKAASKAGASSATPSSGNSAASSNTKKSKNSAAIAGASSLVASVASLFFHLL